MPSLTQVVQVACDRCSQVQDEEIVYVLDADERPDLVRRCLGDRIRKFICLGCGYANAYDLPLLVYRPSDGGLSALLWVPAQDDNAEPASGTSVDLHRLTGWLYGQLGLTFEDHAPAVVPTEMDGLVAMFCRSVDADLQTKYLDEFPHKERYLHMLAMLREERSTHAATE